MPAPHLDERYNKLDAAWERLSHAMAEVRYDTRGNLTGSRYRRRLEDIRACLNHEINNIALVMQETLKLKGEGNG